MKINRVFVMVRTWPLYIASMVMLIVEGMPTRAYIAIALCSVDVCFDRVSVIAARADEEASGR